MTAYRDIRIKIRFNIDDTTHQDFVRYLSFPESTNIGQLIDDIDTRLEMDGMIGDIYYVFDEQLDNPYTEEGLLGGPLFPRNILLIYTIIENGTTLFVQARPRNNVANIMRIIGRIYIQDTGERLNDMLLNVPDGTTIGNLVNYINNELGRQYLTGAIYHINNEDGYQISEQTILGGANYPAERLMTELGINNNSVLYMNCRVTNPIFRNLLVFPQLATNVPQITTQLPVVNIDEQINIMDLNSILDIYGALININPVNIQQNTLNDAVSSLNNLNTLVQALNNPIFTNLQLLNPQNINRRMEDVVVALDKEDLAKLPVSIYTNFECLDENDRDTCSVCFEKFIDSDMCRELKCKHLYHQICIDKWLDEHITCPVCREECGKGVPRL